MKHSPNLNICLIADHNWPIPHKTHTGTICILDLATALTRQGHNVTMVAPVGTQFHNVIPMRCAYGKYPPSSSDCEQEVFDKYRDRLQQFDIVHDFSNTKRITQSLNKIGFMKTCSTLLGGPWLQETPPHNLIVWSESHRDRVLRGATDYEGTPTPTMAGENGFMVKDAHIVHGGIDTSFYVQSKYEKDDYFLWMNRWHPAKGPLFAIELAKKTGIHLILAGEDPANEIFASQAEYANLCQATAKHFSNIEFVWLPKDPNHHLAKRELYRKAKALLYTVQFHEPFGLSQVEALACGTPVIGTNYGSVPEIINNKAIGTVCDNDLQSFANALQAMQFMSPEKCRKAATDRFDRHLFASNCTNEYRKIIAGESW